jgi:hypothetical protein
VAGYNSAKDAEQVIGYSQSTGETTSHPTKQPQNGCQVVGYKPASWQVAGYRNDRSALRPQLKPRCNDGNSKYRHCEQSEAIQQDQKAFCLNHLDCRVGYAS